MENKKHIYSTYVDYQDTDAGGVVYHGAYINFAERARGAFIRDLEENTFGKDSVFVVGTLFINYLKSLRLGDKFDLVTSVKELKRASIVFEQRFYLNNVLYVVMEITLINVNITSTKILRFPESLSKKLQNYIEG